MRKDLKNRFTSPADFAAKWTVSSEIWRRFEQELQKEELEFNSFDLAESRQELEMRIKAQIGKYVFGDEALYRTYNVEDPVINAALEQLPLGLFVAQ